MAEAEEEFVPVKEPKKRKTRKKGASKRKKAPKSEYNVEVHPETGVMQLPELHYCKLIIAEQRIKIQERDLQIAKAHVKDFQIQSNAQMQSLQARVKEASSLLMAARASYLAEAKFVEDETGLTLKDWTIDDDRILRLIEPEKSDEASEVEEKEEK